MDRERVIAISAEAMDHMAKWTPGMAKPAKAPTVTVGELYGLATLALKALDLGPEFGALLTAADHARADPRAFAEAVERAKRFARGMV